MRVGIATDHGGLSSEAPGFLRRLPKIAALELETARSKA
jgi:hypothetical protein